MCVCVERVWMPFAAQVHRRYHLGMNIESFLCFTDTELYVPWL